MNYSMEEKYDFIIEKTIGNSSKNPITIAKSIMQEDFINPNGPEHHFLDGISFLIAYYNAGGNINLDKAIDTLRERAIKMPGGTCGHWGICCSAASLGTVFSIIHGTTPLSSDQFYKDNMSFTSSVIEKMSQIGGPRCCKRNAFISISAAVDFLNKKYGIELEKDTIKCDFHLENPDCIKENCPFYKK